MKKIKQTSSAKVVAACILVYSIIPLYTVQAVELCGRWDSIEVLEGQYHVMNNVWGAETAQCIQVDPNSTYFSVTLSEHDNGTSVASYPAIYKGCHWGSCTQNSGMPIKISEVNSAPFTWSIGTDVSGTWNAAFEAWFDPNGAGIDYSGELMIWISYGGGAGPGGSKVATASIGGAAWDVYSAIWDWNYIAYKITSTTNDVSLDLRDFIDDAVSRGYLETSWYLDNMEAGFEIWRDGQGLTTHSYSASVNEKEGPYGDLTGDGLVDINDLPEFFGFWLQADCNETSDLDLDDNCIINFRELSELAKNWNGHD